MPSDLIVPAGPSRRQAASRILFLDWDGVVRPFGDVDGTGTVRRLSLLSALRAVPGIAVVVTSTRRLMSDDPDHVVGPGFPLPLHADWRTRSEGHGRRDEDIRDWLARHRREVASWVALDDAVDEFDEEARERLVPCRSDTGVGPDQVRAVVATLTRPARIPELPAPILLLP